MRREVQARTIGESVAAGQVKTGNSNRRKPRAWRPLDIIPMDIDHSLNLNHMPAWKLYGVPTGEGSTATR